MGRSTQGCWTCRLRHKKCDEIRPFCRACTSRNIPCHGYDLKPGWFDGGRREQEHRNEIKRAVKSNFKLIKRGNARPSGPRGDHRDTAEAPGYRRPLGSTERPPADPPNPPGTSASTGYTSDETENFNGISLPEHSRTCQSPGRLNYRDAELLMHYFDHVFPLQFRFHAQDLNHGGRGWLLWLLVKTGPLYHAALSLSALHQFTLRSHDQGDRYTELNGYHTNALRDLQLFLQQCERGGDLPRQIEVLACGVSLISFELFRGGLSDWQPHLNALASIVAALTTTPSPPQDSRAGGSARMEDAALPFLVAVVIWFDLVSCASTSAAPRLPYTALMLDRKINLGKVMGCANWVMIVIGDLAALNAWKHHARQTRTLNVRELVSRGQAIETRLEEGLAMLESQGTAAQSGVPAYQAEPPVNRIVSRIFASAARVQLHTILSGAFPHLPEVLAAVERTISALEMVQDFQDMRGLIWPLCITGCMADSSRQPFFERLIKNVLGDSPQDFGNSTAVLEIMRKCWHGREVDDSQEWDWERAMTEMNICALLV